MDIEVKSDYDGYFEGFVRRLVESKTEPLKHTKIVVTAGPWRQSAVSFESKDGVLVLDFYSALRNGFGSLSAEDVKGLQAIL